MSREVGGMVQSKRVKGTGSARTEGARRATGVGVDGAAVGSGALAPVQRWSASRKRDVVLRLLRGESLDAVSREVGVEVYRLEAWKTRALAGFELGLKEQAGAPLAAELDAAKRNIGELSMENELLRERVPAQRNVASRWRRGGHGDERNDLRDDGAALWCQAGVSHVGAVALGALRASGAFRAPSAGHWPSAPRADARAVGATPAGGHSH